MLNFFKATPANPNQAAIDLENNRVAKQEINRVAAWRMENNHIAKLAVQAAESIRAVQTSCVVFTATANIVATKKPTQAQQYAELAAAKAVADAAETLAACRAEYGYDPESGYFRAGGTTDGQGYVQLQRVECIGPVREFRGNTVSGRLAVYLMTGIAPPDGMFVDHKNGQRANNAWKNLQVVTPQQNSNNRSSLTCVSRRPGMFFKSDTQFQATVGTYSWSFTGGGETHSFSYEDDATTAGKARAAEAYDETLREMLDIEFDADVHHSNIYN
jgi:hypothetical protein